MMGRPDEFQIRRIVLALNASAHDRATVVAAARLAARLKAGLEALFVEDINLLHSAELPFVRRASLAAPTWRDFDAAAMERELRSMAAEARRVLAAEAARTRQPWSFRVVRGHPAAAALEAAEHADLLVLARGPDATGAPAPLSSPAGQIAAKATRPVLILRAAEALDRGITVAYDGAPGAERALSAALKLDGASALTVLVVAPTGDDARAIEARAVKQLAGSAHAANFTTMIAPDTNRLCAIGEKNGGILVISADNPLVVGEQAARCLDRARCPILLVR
jgi:nucleotide-binding universal stress UspA family protein